MVLIIITEIPQSHREKKKPLKFFNAGLGKSIVTSGAKFMKIDKIQ
jgi:hypothetical protein